MQAYQQAAMQGVAHWQSSKTVEHYTPLVYVEAARDVMGGIDLDPASNEFVNDDIVHANKYYSVKDNGLRWPWQGRVWLNPPYGRTQGRSSVDVWAGKLVGEFTGGRTTQAVFLCGVRHSELDNVQALMALDSAMVCITDHRIAFLDVRGSPQQSPPGNNLFVYLGENGDRFAHEFARFGIVLRRFV